MDLMFLAEGAVNTIDTGAVSSIVDVTKSALGLFSTYPLNIFLVASFVGIGIGVFNRLRH
ncbi:MAG: hypothetical protein K2N94_09565 [Lachnospiraceae bacterium]|nr:hypothetical protein [Lachnospiraceae bacterium]